MRFSRGQEQAADQAGLTYLDRAGLSGRGLAQMFRILDAQNVLAVSNASSLADEPPADPGADRVRRQLGRHPPRPAAAARVGRRAPAMVAKLKAFLNDPRDTLREFKGDDSLSAATRARSRSTGCRTCHRRSRTSTR